MREEDPPAIAILAGGRSRRMGRDKALLEIGDETLLERTVRVALTASPRVLVIGRSGPENLTMPQVTFLPDDLPDLGPIGGLATALRHAAKPVLLLACDTPALTPDVLRWLVEVYPDLDRSNVNAGGIAVRNGERIEPLFSIYFPSLLSAIESRIEKGNLALHDLISSSRFTILDIPAAYAPQLVNVNTQEEWREIADSRE